MSNREDKKKIYDRIIGVVKSIKMNCYYYKMKEQLIKYLKENVRALQSVIKEISNENE